MVGKQDETAQAGAPESRSRFTIDLIPGDGIGLEVVPAAVEAVDAVTREYGVSIDWRHRDWGSEYFRRHGVMMPADGLDRMSDGDGIFLGAVGDPEIPDDVTLWGLLIPIRRAFMQYVNLRPVRALPGVDSPVRSGELIDLVVVRENVEGEYSQIGGRMYQGSEQEAAFQQAIFTRTGVTRVAEYAARLAASRNAKLTSATKSNGIIHTMPFWDEVVQEVADKAGVPVEHVLIDALAAKLVATPESFSVIVASNLFGDVLSDLAGAIAGSIGVAPSANLNPERRYPSMFEPVHGSAPDIAGQGVANPVGQMWTAVMMLEHLGLGPAAAHLMGAIEKTLEQGLRTRDLGGSAGTAEFTQAVCRNI
ncbi:tartrate dehydrogenase [Streptomyces sp. NPDC046805]|uniref:tartrate dehydrogenase n=1 Tax=Streptomyces sp. NPDC046805 TaxID=3155134 RepID=UPI0033FF900A